jgi:hypothetical protein
MGNRNNFGRYVSAELKKMGRSHYWLENTALISIGSINRWSKGSVPEIDNYFAVMSILAKYQRRKITELIADMIDFMPYLTSDNHGPVVCPCCKTRLSAWS